MAAPFSRQDLQRLYDRGLAALSEPVPKPFDLHFGPTDRPRASETDCQQPWDQYQHVGYLPAPENPRHNARARVLRRFNLHQSFAPGRYPMIDEITAFAKELFAVDAAMVNVVTEDTLFFVSAAGWVGRPGEGTELPNDVCVCTHAMSKPAGSDPLNISDLRQDWRFARNPLAQEDRPLPMRFFANTNIDLPLSGPVGAEAERYPVGTLCLISSKPKPPLDAAQQALLKRLGSIVTKELELSHERERQAIRDAQSDAITDLFTTLVIRPAQALSQASLPPQFTPKNAGFAGRIRELLSSDYVALVDLRSADLGQLEKRPPGALSLLDLAVSDPDNPAAGELATLRTWTDRLQLPETLDTVREILTAWDKAEQVSFAISSDLAFSSGPEQHMVRALPGPFAKIAPECTTAALVLPLFDHRNHPALLLVVGSYENHFEYEQDDVRFLRNCGIVAISSLLQETVFEATGAKLRFVSGMSHELRTPIFAIASQLALMRDIVDNVHTGTLVPLLDAAETYLTALRDTLDDTLEFSQSASSPSATSATQLTLIDALVDECIRSTLSKRDKGASEPMASPLQGLEIYHETALPEGFTVAVDVAGLKRVLVALVENAIKFTPAPGTVTVTSSISSTSAGAASLRFCCEDTGCGMTADDIKSRLFIPFEQADSFSRGTGLGVAIARAIVARMGGRLHYTSVPGQGTTARLEVPVIMAKGATPLPRARPFRRAVSEQSAQPDQPSTRVSSMRSDLQPDTRQDDHTKPTISAPAGSAKRLREQQQALRNCDKIKLLVVDDNSVARKVLCAYLRSKKVDFREASDGDEAVEAFKEYQPNLIWCDVQMPRMNGLEATRLMRQHEAERCLKPARIIIVSGLAASLGEHELVIQSRQVNLWLVKGTETLRELGTDLIIFAQDLHAQAADGEDVTLSSDLSRLAIASRTL